MKMSEIYPKVKFSASGADLPCLTFSRFFGIYEAPVDYALENMKIPAQGSADEAEPKPVKNGKRELFCERQGKSFYHTEKPDLLIQEIRSNGVDPSKKKAKTRDVSSLRNEISAYLLEYVEGFHIPTYFVSKLSPTEMAVKRSEPIPLTVRVFNRGDNGLAERFGLKSGKDLDFPVIEHFFHANGAGAAWVNEFHVSAFGIATPEEMKQINRISSKVNAVLRGLCDRRQLGLADLTLEFGRYKGQVILSEELSPVTCHFLDYAAEKTADRFHPGHDGYCEESLAELRDRLRLTV
jgi:phosphoribosylaminoimidazole-succinocarboxamide synthase